jgi:hypothetical protein
MQRFIKHFRRENGGVWVCIEPAEITLPQGRIQVAPGARFERGAKFMNVELAALLEEQLATDQP